MRNIPLPVPLPDVTILICSCCGAGVADTPEANVDYATRGQDTGYGMCRECGGGEPTTWQAASEMTEAELRKLQGWALVTIYDARMPIVRAALSEPNRAKWDVMPYWRRCMFIEAQMEKGNLV